MALPFKNGMELAQAMGFGKMYIASKQEKENEMQMESKKTNSKLIRLTESDLHQIVKESVQRILKEYSEYETTKQQQERLNKKKKPTAEKLPDYETVKQQQERLNKRK